MTPRFMLDAIAAPVATFSNQRGLGTWATKYPIGLLVTYPRSLINYVSTNAFYVRTL